jgi:hypothetical protein
MLIKNENSSNETPLSDPQNDFKLSYESIEKAESLNKYFSSMPVFFNYLPYFAVVYISTLLVLISL